MKSIWQIILCFLVVSCGPKDTPTPKNKITDEQKEQLKEMRSKIESWARECTEGIACGTNTLGDAEDGDSMLWAGLLCLSGEDNQCDAVEASIGLDGSLHRNPDKDRIRNSSSRDMFMGFLAYLLATGNESMGNLVYDYINDNNLKLCNDAADNRCQLSHPNYNSGWSIWYYIWKHHNFKTKSHMEIGKDDGGELILNIQTAFSAEGYPRHLSAVQLLLHQRVNNWSFFKQDAANQLVLFQPNNPFFIYIAQGPTEKVARLVLEKCPTEQPQPASNDWAWQRDESEKAWKKAKGWDCIFMANILLGDR
jgi:hypothetical protein